MFFFHLLANAQSLFFQSFDTNAHDVNINTFFHDSLGFVDVIPSFDECGRLIIPINSDEFMLANFLNTSPDIAKKILYIWNCNDSSLFVQDTSNKTLSGIPRLIYKHLDDEFSRFLFLNYWTGGGDIVLTDRQFAEILICVKSSKDTNKWISEDLHSNTKNKPCQFSFYNTKYCEAFGVATFYINSDNRIVGFSDTYDFDAKKWGIRPLKYELLVRLVALLSPSNASGFNIIY